MTYETPPFQPLDPPPPLLLVISGPSGVGKNAVCDDLFRDDPSLTYSVSATTRAPRSDETEGVDYHFMDEATFREGIGKDHFLEWAEVHGSLYGTPREPVDRLLAAGRTPVLNLDVQGGRAVKRLVPNAVLIFLAPPSWEELERRLRSRATDSDETIALRLQNARDELRAWVDYDYQVVNNRLGDAVAGVQEVIRVARAETPRLMRYLRDSE